MNKELHFKLIYYINNWMLPIDELKFEVKLQHSVKVRLVKCTSNEAGKIRYINKTACIAEMSKTPNKSNKNIFEDILNRKYTKSKDTLYCCQIVKNENNEDVFIPNINDFPLSFVDFVKQTETELFEAIKKVIFNLRWVCDMKGPLNPFSERNLFFSVDEKQWYPMPSNYSIEGRIVLPDTKLNKVAESIVNDNIEKQINEPIYHSLFREAWDLKLSNNRSSMIIAITSIEVAVKYLIEKIAPEASWFIQNTQSPPIYKIFKEYIPKLDFPNKINGKALLFPESIISKIQIWVSQRNQLTHAGKDALSGALLNEMLLSVKDILHIIDFNCGHNWAISSIRKETLLEIGFDETEIKNWLSTT